MRSSGTKVGVGATVLWRRKKVRFSGLFPSKIPIHKVVFGSLKISFGTAEVVWWSGSEQHVVVSQGSLHNRGRTGVVGKVWVSWVNQGWSVSYDLEQNSSILAHSRLDPTCMFWRDLTLNSPGSTWVGWCDLWPASGGVQHKSCQSEQPAMKCKLWVDEFVLMKGEINSCHNPLERMSQNRTSIWCKTNKKWGSEENLIKLERRWKQIQPKSESKTCF